MARASSSSRGVPLSGGSIRVFVVASRLRWAAFLTDWVYIGLPRPATRAATTRGCALLSIGVEQRIAARQIAACAVGLRTLFLAGSPASEPPLMADVVTSQIS